MSAALQTLEGRLETLFPRLKPKSLQTVQQLVTERAQRTFLYQDTFLTANLAVYSNEYDGPILYLSDRSAFGRIVKKYLATLTEVFSVTATVALPAEYFEFVQAHSLRFPLDDFRLRQYKLGKDLILDDVRYLKVFDKRPHNTAERRLLRAVFGTGASFEANLENTRAYIRGSAQHCHVEFVNPDRVFQLDNGRHILRLCSLASSAEWCKVSAADTYHHSSPLRIRGELK